MTEAEWLACPLGVPLLEVEGVRVDARRQRLVACGCCRALWDALTDPRSQKAVRKLEEFADNLGNVRLRRDAYNIANAAYLDVRAGAASNGGSAAFAVVCAAYPVVPLNLFGNFRIALGLARGWDGTAICQYEAEIVRDVFGNPFRPVSFLSEWRTDTAVALARQVYESREFGAMPILADALQDAGCDSEVILSHCRGAHPHVRGCWVVDLVLGKE